MYIYICAQWPGAYCDTKHSCCYPKSGKPAADFGIHGLWPNYKDGSYPSNCDPDSVFDKSEVRSNLKLININPSLVFGSWSSLQTRTDRVNKSRSNTYPGRSPAKR